MNDSEFEKLMMIECLFKKKGNGSHPMHPMHGGPHGNMQMPNGSPLRSIHQMNNQFGLNNHPMDGPPMHNNRGGMMPSNMQQV